MTRFGTAAIQSRRRSSAPKSCVPIRPIPPRTLPGTHDVGGYLRVLGGEHFVLGGTEGADRIYGDTGIDTLWGDGGNDYLNGMTESDDVFGGDGDDVIEDPFGDDVLRGNEGNDVITTARGAGLAVRQSGPRLHRGRPGCR